MITCKAPTSIWVFSLKDLNSSTKASCLLLVVITSYRRRKGKRRIDDKYISCVLLHFWKIRRTQEYVRVLKHPLVFSFLPVHSFSKPERLKRWDEHFWKKPINFLTHRYLPRGQLGQVVHDVRDGVVIHRLDVNSAQQAKLLVAQVVLIVIVRAILFSVVINRQRAPDAGLEKNFKSFRQEKALLLQKGQHTSKKFEEKDNMKKIWRETEDLKKIFERWF